MAIQNNPNMFSAGAVSLNSQPTVNLYAQMLQRKQAREEALDAYEMNRINRMNEQGVRDIDRLGLDQRVIDMKTYYNANKDKIREGGTPESYNYERMFRDTLAGVAKSKNATARAETFNKIRLERQKLGRNTPEEWFNDYQSHEDTPVWDEKFTELDLPKYMAQNTVKYDPKKTLDLFKDIKRVPLAPRYEAVPGDRFSRVEIVDEAFDKDAKMNIAARANDMYDTNDGFAEVVQKDFSNPVRRGELEKLFVQEYGTQPQSMGDYASAKMLEQLQPKIPGKPKIITNREKLLEQQHKNSISRLYVYANIQDRKPETIGRNIDNLIGQHIEDARNNNGHVITDNATFESITGKKATSNSFLMFDEGQNKYVYGRKGEDGVTVTLGEVPVDLARIKLTKTYKSGLDSRYNTGKNITPKENYLIKGKTYTAKQLLDMGYTLDQIKPYKQ